MAGPVDIDPAKPHAFLSYTRFDDKFLSGGISALREALELAVQARTGKRFNIFQDVDDIKPGDAWRKKLDRAIEAAQLFIPILTPSFFESDFCRSEAEAFLSYEERAGRDDLVLPIYLIDTPRLDDPDQRATDDLASSLHERQYADWRPLRFMLQDNNTRPRIDELAGSIAAAIAKNGKISPAPPPTEPTLPADIMDRLSALEAGREERDEALAAERSERERLEVELADEKAKSRELADAPTAFEGQIEEAKKSEVALRDEVQNLKEQLAETGLMSVQKKLAQAETALEKERAKHEKFESQAPGIPTSFYLGSATLALLVGLGVWIAGSVEFLSPDIDHAVADEFFRDCNDCPEMVVIPHGSFFMGSDKSERGNRDNERPLHRVDLQSFAIGKYEVTFFEWGVCVAAGDCDHEPSDAGWGGGKQPVINVSWEDAQQYVEWLSRETGETYRLPSEAEWEYAARAFPTTKGANPPAYAFGETISNEQANFAKQLGRTVEIGSYPGNDWGVDDMHGNVWEWVEDRWHDDYKNAPEDGSAWMLGNDSGKVLRGGSWGSGFWGLRSAYRNRSEPDIRLNFNGFRVAKTLTP